MSTPVQDQYEKWPYPAVPLVASVPQEHLWQIHLNWIRSRCGLAPLKTQSSIWIAGCGTFEPYLFSRSNPESKILATDISQQSLKIARRRLRWHGRKNVELQQINLANSHELPEGPFDFIECYGVLMCLPNPLETLKHLSSRLKPDGILRLMVYPHYSRQRVFQIQKLAKLLGLSYRHPAHPKILRKVLTALPKNHPLHYAFSTYWDARNLPGIIDGFLHASDRGFTGFELCSLIDEANLKPAFCFHRPWGQPNYMAQKLSKLGDYNFSFWLHYLDLWQSIRTNFTICLTKKDLETTTNFSPQRHPLFNLKNPYLGLAQKTRLLKLAITGAKLPSRTAELPVQLTAKNVMNEIWGDSRFDGFNSQLSLRPSLEEWDSNFDKKAESILPDRHFKIRIGTRVLNPLYDYLFDAYTFGEKYNAVFNPRLPDLETQISTWENEAFPLESDTLPWGLTPYGTYIQQKDSIKALIPDYLGGTEETFETYKLPNEQRAFNEVLTFLKGFDLPRVAAKSPSTLRQLWILLFSYDKLFIDETN